jgi:hypothetical protein
MSSCQQKQTRAGLLASWPVHPLTSRGIDTGSCTFHPRCPAIAEGRGRRRGLFPSARTPKKLDRLQSASLAVAHTRITYCTTAGSQQVTDLQVGTLRHVVFIMVWSIVCVSSCFLFLFLFLFLFQLMISTVSL